MNKNNLFKHLYFKNYNSNDFEIDTNNENECNFISSRGIIKSCNIKSIFPESSSINLNRHNFSDGKDGCILYVCSTALIKFKEIIGQIGYKFILVTGDSDITVPNDIFSADEFKDFIENDKIIHWFSQNCIEEHSKLSKIPIGLDYHTLGRYDHEWGSKMTGVEQEKELLSLKVDMKPFWERKLICYSNFHFHLSGKYCDDRRIAIQEISKELIFFEDKKIKRIDSWKNQLEYAFVISPHGNGLDCHRTWEALCLGCIPIVKKSKIDSLYDDLPVLIVDNWKDIKVELLEKIINGWKDKKFNYDKLSLKYWINKINIIYEQT
jgi:hypothetical protein